MRCDVSKDHIDNSRTYFSNNRNIANFSLTLKEIIFTIVIQNANGSHFKDLNGNDYLDLTMGFGVHLFGHKAVFLEEAMEEQIKKGITLGPLYKEAAEVAQLIHELTGNDRCAFYNTGTEAVMVAMRIARAATKKNKIVIFEGSYHGTHDSLLGIKTDPVTNVIISSVPGITQNAVDSTLILTYGDPKSVSFIHDNADQIAGVLIEPVMSRHPEIANPEFLKQLRDICSSLNIALIFDEVITGFRIGNKGAAHYFGITPDITIYGKILGGGIPIGVVAGKKKYLDTIDGGIWKFGDESVPQSTITFTAGTFNHHPVAMATAKATLLFLKKHGDTLQEELNLKTKNLCDELNVFFLSEGFPIMMVSFASLFRFKLAGRLKLLFYSLLKEGIYIWEGRNCFLSVAHTDDDIKFLIRKVKKCCYELAAAGILKCEKIIPENKSQHSLQAAIRVAGLLEKNNVEFVCKYLFLSIPALQNSRCTLKFDFIREDLECIISPANDVTGLNVSVFQGKNDTIIRVSAERNLCDGWSMILFFKALANCYSAFQKNEILPELNYLSSESLNISQTDHANKTMVANTLHGTIPMKNIPKRMNGKLFPFLLDSFYSSIEDIISLFNNKTILVPVAGQLLQRKLKAFGQYTVHIPIIFPTTYEEMSISEKMECLEGLLKNGKQIFNQEADLIQSNIIFNLDNLDFEMNFAGEKVSFLPIDESITGYDLVCNVTKLSDSLIVSLKYSKELFTEKEMKVILHIFLERVQKNIFYENI